MPLQMELEWPFWGGVALDMALLSELALSCGGDWQASHQVRIGCE
jgi:hypothetical protein